jgi:nicotinic acid mononucleotide adenylyltransferase
VYPGSFNPPTTAHLHIAEAAREQRGVDVVVFVVSRSALAKQTVQHPEFHHRMHVLADSVAEHPWIEVRTTGLQLLSEIAAGFDLLVMGADKWQQINDPVWYGDDSYRRDSALRSLPEVAIAPRPPIPVPREHTLEVHEDHAHTSSTLARSGALELMLPVAQHFALESGAWIEPDRYERWRSGLPRSRSPRRLPAT